MTRPAIHLTRVREDGQGARLGLKPGDCLTDIGGNPVTTPETFAAALAAIAVIAVDLDYSEISKGNNSMILLVASGTAVVIAPA